MSEKGFYKYCVVPNCCNTTKTAPDKLFISVPYDPATRELWQKAMHRYVFVSDKSHVYCCEDHFNVQEDIENYMYIKTMKKGIIRLRPNVVPRFFDCQTDRVTAHRPKPPSPCLQKRDHQSLINSLLYPETSEISIKNEDVEQENEMKIEPKFKDIGVLASLKPKFRSKAVQCTITEDLRLSKKRKKRKGKERVSKEKRLEGNSITSVSTSDTFFTPTFPLSEERFSVLDSDSTKPEYPDNN